MRLDTKVWIRCESKGRPAETIQRDGTIRDCILELADWLSKVYMGSHIEIRIARNEADLHRSTREREMATLAGELEGLLAGTDLGTQADVDALENAAERIDPTRPSFPMSPEECPNHVASAEDAKRCGRCGTHINELRDEPAESRP